MAKKKLNGQKNATILGQETRRSEIILAKEGCT